MATRQYIGARYVPKFYVNSVDGSAAWESNVVYAPLTYVTLTNGHMYISKKQVPATVGTPASNAEYWLDIGSYNGFIDSLQNQIDAIVDTTIPAIENEISNIDVVTRPTLFVGDSYGDAAGEFINLTISKLGMTNAHNLSVTGAGFTTANTFLSQIQSYSGDKNEIEAIYVLGGLNDSTPANRADGGTTLRNAMNAFATYAHQNYPNAKLYLGFIGNAIDNAQNLSNRTLFYRLFAKYWYSQNQNFCYFDMSTVLCPIKSNFQSDGIHPSTDGTNALCKALINYMLGGSYKVCYPTWSTGINYESNFEAPESATNIQYEVEGDVTKIIFNDGFGVHPKSSITISYNRTKVLTFDNLYFNRKYSIVALSRMDGNYDGAGSYQDHILKWELDGDGLYVSSEEINSNHSGYASFTGGGAIRMKGQVVLLVNTIDIN